MAAEMAVESTVKEEVPLEKEEALAEDQREGASAPTDQEGLSATTMKEKASESVRREGHLENVRKEEVSENVLKEGASALTDQEGLQDSQQEGSLHSEAQGIRQRVHSTRRISITSVMRRRAESTR